MADLSLLQEDLQEEIDGSLDFVSQDEMLTPLGRLDKYAASENIFNRQMVARTLLDTLKAVSEDERDCIAVLERVSRLADDSEPTVRAELMEQVPHIAIFCQENRPSIPYAFSKYLLPIVVAYLADQNNQVRKTSQAALLVLLEQELIERYDIETKVCPVLVDLIAPDSNDDVKTEAMAIICKMAPMVGKDITERLFLPRFCEMCCDCRMFHVRKVCAANFGDVCTVVGQEATEELLLPRFFQLCSDNVWGVRKACAECFMTVSSATSQGVRRTKLSSLFINLISDPSRWVRQAAFQSLGQFISTFANPASSGQYFKEDEEPEDTTNTRFHSSSEAETEVPSSKSGVSTCGEDATTKTEENGQHCCKTGENLQPSEILQNPQSWETEEKSQSCETRESEQCSDIKNHRCCQIEERQQFCDSTSSSSQQGEEEKDNVTQVLPSLRDSAPQNCGRTTLESQPLICTSSRAEPADAATATTTTSSSCTLSGTISKDKPIPEQELYNSFHYWRTPLPLIDLEVELQEAQEAQETQKGSQETHSSQSPLSSISPARRKELEEMIENLEPHVDDPDVKAQVDVLTAALRASTLGSQLENSTHKPFDNRIETQREAATPDHFSTDAVPLITDTADIESLESTLGFIHGDDSEMSDCSLSPEEERKCKQQDVVPQALLDQYLSMTDPCRAQTVDTEIAKHCAHSLPGVALTLGRQNWHCLKDTYETLASDMQWKVRRTLAFSIHEVAVILGDQLTAADLVPVFNGFLKDLDEVRIGVLKHLYDFLKLLHKEMRREYLYQLQEFLVTDNSRNWRFRAELAEQLVLLLDLYCGKDVYDYLRPLAFSLCTDRVSSVRWTSYKLICEIIKKLSSDSQLVADFMAELVDKFCHCSKWSGRQAFAFVCQSVIEDDCISMDLFAEHLLPPLLQLASDPVPNVRVLLAKTLRHSLLEKDYFIHSASSHQEALEQTLVALQMDLDKDVQYFASVHPANTRLADDAMSTTSSTY
ncbi:serine/threonine-protein phosphatase 4 regulatory subunit 1-like isoform X2 [Polyodon spathula]|uniref:serine/threonine-protein phosphatase 4 regulatory subunit 1-like isoform X2 n=1 Tax=Polyodon spathula TaxID=7913 RepID=UPI001B7F705A|nr:serine/threonine-protein phosphatase 4 regulatory subunit 1-like isoform X2 [Polyodon spathula]